MKPLATRVRHLGYNKGIRRLWIEGADLVKAGFVAKDTYYIRTYDTDTMTLHLDVVDEDAVITSAPFKVSGKGSTPIIDITGTDLQSFFEGSEKVEVSFYPNEVHVRRHVE